MDSEKLYAISTNKIGSLKKRQTYFTSISMKLYIIFAQWHSICLNEMHMIEHINVHFI